MSQASGVPLEELRQYMFLYHDREATEHIMRVSGGLDSLVMGEGQILAQVRGAVLRIFTSAASSNPIAEAALLRPLRPYIRPYQILIQPSEVNTSTNEDDLTCGADRSSNN